MPRIENWFIFFNSICGNVYGHPDHQDGKFIRTSRVLERTSNQIKTKNRTYLLGKESKNPTFPPEFVK